MRELKVRSLGLACAATALSAVAFLAPGTASATVVCGSGPSLDGNGSSLQANAQTEVWSPGFDAICAGEGKSTTVTYSSTSSGKGLKSWDIEPEPPTKKVPFKGFGAKNAFVGTDQPPNKEQEKELLAEGGGKVLSIPVMQASIALPIHLPTGCTATTGKKSKLQKRLALSDEVLQKIWSREIKDWNEVATYNDDALTGGAACDVPIERVVRKEGSGSTSILKKFLFEINNKTLSDGETWNKSAEGSSNTNWPEKSTDLKEAEKGSGVTAEVESVPGTIGYANLNEVREKPAFGKAPNGSEFWPLLESKGKKYADPSTDEEQTTPANANCAAEEYISLNGVDKQEKFPPASTEDVWNEVTASTVQKKSYPLCGFTYDLALTEYTLFSAASEGAEEDAEPTTAPEVETLKNYLTFVLDEGQKLVGEKHDFYPLPEGKKGGNVLAVARAGLAKIGF